MTKKVAISLADDLLDAVDQASRGAGVTRSWLLAEAARSYLDEAERRRQVEAYVSSYAADPETEDEMQGTENFLRRHHSSEAERDSPAPRT